MKQIKLIHIYPKEMNIYGDTGNRIVLLSRLKWRGYKVKVQFVGVGDTVPPDADIILGGGGQDAGQLAIEQDLQAKTKVLHKLADGGVPMLMVCGMYQMFCRRFVTNTGHDIKGIGILAAETFASSDRTIGNLNASSSLGTLVGYENHSGKTYLDDKSQALGRVMKGAGNNGRDKTEGCIYKNVFGTYMHGPVLSKNPVLADHIIHQALMRKGLNSEVRALDDGLELLAQKVAQHRPR